MLHGAVPAQEAPRSSQRCPLLPGLLPPGFPPSPSPPRAPADSWPRAALGVGKLCFQPRLQGWLLCLCSAHPDVSVAHTVSGLMCRRGRQAQGVAGGPQSPGSPGKGCAAWQKTLIQRRGSLPREGVPAGAVGGCSATAAPLLAPPFCQPGRSILSGPELEGARQCSADLLGRPGGRREEVVQRGPAGASERPPSDTR